VNGEAYVKHLMFFDHLLEKKGYGSDLADAAKAVLKASLTLKKHTKVPKGEEDPDKAIRLTKSRQLKESSMQPRSSRATSRVSPMTSSTS